MILRSIWISLFSINFDPKNNCTKLKLPAIEPVNEIY